MLAESASKPQFMLSLRSYTLPFRGLAKELLQYLSL